MTTSPSRALQALVWRTLCDDVAVGEQVGDRIFDHRPSLENDGVFPCVTFGPADQTTDDEECIDGQLAAMQVDVWSRDDGRIGPAQDIVWAVRAALHDRDDLDMDGSWALHSIRVTQTRVFLDPDGVTAHGVVTVEAMLET